MIRESEEASASGVERFSVPVATSRWLEFFSLEHATLPAPSDFFREGDDWIVRRSPVAGRRIASGRIPGDQGAILFLQAAGLCAFLQAFGLWLDEEDLTSAVFDRSEGIARLWLLRTPASVYRGGTGPAPSAVLAAFLHRLFARGRRIGLPGARSLFDRLVSPDAGFLRAEFWLASAFRSFPELGAPASAGARLRTIGSAVDFGPDAARRARWEAAAEQLRGRRVRVFRSDGSRLTPGGALGLPHISGRASDAARQLRERHEREESEAGRPAVWIAVEPRGWDDLSRRAFESAVQALGSEIEPRVIEGAPRSPQLPDEWRRRIFVPCGTVAASLAFYDEFAELVRPEPDHAVDLARRTVASGRWASFVSDPTGNSPVPWPRASVPATPALPVPASDREILECLASCDIAMEVSALTRLFPRRPVTQVLASLESRLEAVRGWSGSWRATEIGRLRASLSGSRRRLMCRRRGDVEKNPGNRIELLLEAGAEDEAILEAEKWFRSEPGRPPEQWFGLSARLASSGMTEVPVWLDLLEAERELAGGRRQEAQTRLNRIAASSESTLGERRIARLRVAEARVNDGPSSEAGRLAAEWRRAFPDAPPGEQARALRVEAHRHSRTGDHEQALSLLDEAERVLLADDFESRFETAQARADVLSAAGRLVEEAQIYEQWRPVVLARQDDAVTARFLAREALSLSDRRDFVGAVARLEEALGVLRDDAAQRAAILLDLTTALYHGGRSASCMARLEEAIGLTSAIGRRDLLRCARSNRLELWINDARWDEASREIELLLRTALDENDERWRQVALHHRSRLALRRGYLEEAARDNAEARSLSSRLRDRLEVGELWLEEGDRCVYRGDFDAARHAYGEAAADPPDRCDSELRARRRLAELDAASENAPSPESLEELQEMFTRDPYTAAEQTARWHVIRGGRCGRAEDLCRRGEEVLRARGGDRLADRVFGPSRGAGEAMVTSASLAELRAAAAASLAGQEVGSPLTSLGLAGLGVEDVNGREVIAFGDRPISDVAMQRRSLRAGAMEYRLWMTPPVPEQSAASIAFLIETLLFRVAAVPPPLEFAEGWKRLGVVAADPAMEQPYRRLVAFAPQPVTVIVRGESGTGKEAVARAVRSLSPRASGPFVAVNVPGIPPALLESELFGHARGAFTGADRDRRGLIEEAHGGTIFFDEIGDLPLSLQAKLLRALQEGEIRRVGENRSRAMDVRVVSATSRQLEREVESGAFREDLYYRLHVAVVALPPLRERGRDVVLLARHFLERFGEEYGRGSLQYSPEALSALAAYSWPGNIRELQNAVAQAAALAEPNGRVDVDLLPESLRRTRRGTASVVDYRTGVDAHRRGLISEALERSGGNRSRAARELGLSRQALLYLIRELNVTSRPRSGH